MTEHINPPVTIVIADLETTGVNVDTAGVVQLAAVALLYNQSTNVYDSHPLLQTYCQPSAPMEPKALEVHGIGEDKYRYAPTDSMAMWALSTVIRNLPKPVVLSGYNSTRFDYPIMQRLYPGEQFTQYPQIDMMTLAMRETPEHGLKLTEVFERKFGALQEGQDLLLNAHDALADCHMTAWLLQDWMKGHKTTDALSLANWCNTPTLLAAQPFGKWKGRAFKDVPISYLQWMRSTWTDMAPDLDYTLRHHGVN